MRHRRSLVAVSHLLALVCMLGVILFAAAVMPRQEIAGGYDAGGSGASTLGFEPRSLTVPQGGSASARVTVTLTSGKSWGTDLRVTEAPAGLTVVFAPTSGNPTFVSTMTVTASPGTRDGVFTVRIQATGDDPSDVTPYRVTVTRAETRP